MVTYGLSEESIGHEHEIEGGELMNKEKISEVIQKDRLSIQRLEEEGEKIFKIPGIEQAFQPLPDSGLTIGCVDEGVAPFAQICFPGSCCLLSEQSDMAERLKNMGAGILTTHEECGAFSKYKELNPSGPSNEVEWGLEWAKKWELEYRHIPGKKMKRDLAAHHARVVYYLGTPFQKDRIPGWFPDGFTISRFAFKPDEAMGALALCEDIAFGKNGFRSAGLEGNLHIIVIGNPDDPNMALAKLMDEARITLNGYPITIHGVEALK